MKFLGCCFSFAFERNLTNWYEMKARVCVFTGKKVFNVAFGFYL